jgi:hypothetical protein
MSKVEQLIAEGFEQVSRRYRRLARLPYGKTGLEALAEVDPELAAHMLDSVNRRAAEQYMRVYAKDDEKIELNAEEFDEYLRLTRRSA